MSQKTKDPPPKLDFEDLKWPVVKWRVGSLARKYPGIVKITLHVNVDPDPRYLVWVEVSEKYEELLERMRSCKDKLKEAKEARNNKAVPALKDELKDLRRDRKVFNVFGPESFPQILGKKWPEIYVDNSCGSTDDWVVLLGNAGESPDGVVHDGWTLYEKLTKDGLPKRVVLAGMAVLPKVERLYKRILSGLDSLSRTDETEMMRIAIDVIEDDPEAFFPITEEFLNDSTLYNSLPHKAKRDFCGKLIKKLLEAKGFAIENYKDFYASLQHRTTPHKSK